MARKKKKTERRIDTECIVTAFKAACKLYDTWDSPEGPAVVRDVHCRTGGRYTIVYRLISVWGKEAW